MQSAPAPLAFCASERKLAAFLSVASLERISRPWALAEASMLRARPAP